LVDDSMMSAAVPLSAAVWVPLTTAAFGLLAGLGAAAWTQRRADRREDVRWERERDIRQDQWRREDSLRWLQDRQQAYARLIAALHEWDAVLLYAMAIRRTDARVGERSELDTAEMRRVRGVAREMLPLVQFMASQLVRSLATSAVTEREEFSLVHLRGDKSDSAAMDARWTRLAKRTSSLHKAMRGDLKLEGGEVDVTEQLLAEYQPQQVRRWWRPWRARRKRLSAPGAKA
jgi:hypothetical protein